MDVRIDPDVSTTTVAGVEVAVSELLLGGVPRGAALVLAGPDGLGAMEAVDTMNSLAQHGYESVLARPAESGAVDDDASREIIRYLLDRADDRGWTHEQIGVIGYGAGARAALLAGSEATFGAAISVPRDARRLLVPERITSVRTPWVGLVGLGSGSELSGEMAVYRDEVADASTEHTSVVGYAGVGHCLHDSTEAVVHQAAFDSWQRTAEWLNIHVAPRPTPLAEAWRERRQSVQTTPH